MSTIIDTVEAVVLFIVVLGGLVLLHELGHFIVARLAKVRVLEFGVGFPPRARLLGRRGETDYTLNWLPIGGFVRLEGEDGDEGEGDPNSFARARLPVKLLIMVAGVGMNLLISLAIFTSIAWFATPFVGVRVGSVDPGSPAAAAGLTGGDVVTSIDGHRYDFFGAYGGGTILDGLYANAGNRVVLGITHTDGSKVEVSATLRSQADVAAGKGALGIIRSSGGFESVFLDGLTGRPFPTAVGIAAAETGRWFGLILGGLGSLVGSVVTNPTAAPPVSGPVGIATSLGDIFRSSGLIMTLYVAGILSANLALVNVLPFPPLDGGRMFVLLLKAIPRYGARISLRAERLTYAIGFLALFGFLIWVTVFDIAKGISGGAQ